MPVGGREAMPRKNGGATDRRVGSQRSNRKAKKVTAEVQ